MTERLLRLAFFVVAAVVLLAGEARAQYAVGLRLSVAAESLTKNWEPPEKADFEQRLRSFLVEEMKSRFRHWTFLEGESPFVIEFAVTYRDGIGDTVVGYRVFDTIGEDLEQRRERTWLKPDDFAFRPSDAARTEVEAQFDELFRERKDDLEGLLRLRVPIGPAPANARTLWQVTTAGELELVLPLPATLADELKISSFKLACDNSGDTWLKVKGRGRMASIAGGGEGVLTKTLERTVTGQTVPVEPDLYEAVQALPLLAIYLDKFERPNPFTQPSQ